MNIQILFSDTIRRSKILKKCMGVLNIEIQDYTFK